MIDPRRWILVEVWLSLGLRIEWMPRWSVDNVKPADWMADDEDRLRYIYDGSRLWLVRDERLGHTKSGLPTAPILGVETLRHELAHYLAASPAQRLLRNFGAGEDDESRAIETEQILDAVINASARIADMAMRGRDGGR